MHIREASEKDIPQILQVLKASLGETSSKKTEDVWRFKHIDNPFGRSLVFVAEEEQELIGVRAFMRWQWQQRDVIYSAFRAVDTATHPNHQGKGIFKSLTLTALQEGKQRGDNFVFNTPNSQSKPGYLKMGWEEVGKIKINAHPINPFYWKKKLNNNGGQIHWSEDSDWGYLQLFNIDQSKTGKLFTPKTQAYLKWRFIDNPLQQYRILSMPGIFLAGYVKQHKWFRELRISEMIIAPDISLNKIKKELEIWAKTSGAHFITSSPYNKLPFRFSIVGNFGPNLTFRGLNLKKDEQQQFMNLEFWAYRLGDLELF